MDGDEIRLIERRSRMVAYELRAKRIEMSGIDVELRGVSQRVESGRATFSSIKEKLLCAAKETSPALQPEALLRARTLAGALEQVQRFLTGQREELAVLTGKFKAAEMAAAKLDRTGELLAERKNGIQKQIEGRVEQIATEELHEIHATKKEREVSSARNESPDSQEKEIRHVQPISHREAPSEPEACLQIDQGQRSPSQNHQQPEYQPASIEHRSAAPRAFGSALSAAQRDQVESLAAWERLGEHGVQFQLSLGSKRDLGIEIISRSDGGVRVLLEPGSVRDIRALRAARSAIGQALSDRGCVVKEVVVRGRRF